MLTHSGGAGEPLRRERLLPLALAFSMVWIAAPGSADERPAAPETNTESAPAAGAADDSMRYLIDTGPLRIRDQFPLSMGFLAFDPVGATVLASGEWQIDVVSTLTNTFATSEALRAALDAREERGPVDGATLDALERDDPGRGLFLVDGEIVRSALAVRRGFGRGVQVELVVPVLDFGGGHLDSTIESFHDRFGFDPAGREGADRGRFQALVRGESGTLEILSAPGAVLGDLVIGTKIRLFEPTERWPVHLALDALVKLPTGEAPLASSDSIDLGVQLVGSRYFRTGCLHGALGVLRLGEWEALGIGQQTLLSGMLAYEQGLGRKTTVLLQTTVSETPFDDLGLEELNRPSIQATIGVKRVVAESNVLFLGLTENIQNFNNSADIGVHVGWTRTLRTNRRGRHGEG